jgi:signal peptidase I
MRMHAQSLRTRAGQYWRKEIRPLLVVALVLFAIRSSLADWNDVPTGSMKPTILEGDRVYVNKLAYDLKLPFSTWHIAQWANPQRGDIVVFYSPHDGKRLVKRVIGLPGDTLELRNNRLILNGQPVAYQALDPELFADVASDGPARQFFAAEALPGQSHRVAAIPGIQARRNFGPFQVPEGSYFMMGDNRDNSFDSRYWGPVPRSRILGRATSVVLSLDREHYWRPRWHRFFTSLQG